MIYMPDIIRYYTFMKKILKLLIFFGVLFGLGMSVFAIPSYETCKNYFYQKNFSKANQCAAQIVSYKPNDLNTRYLYAMSFLYLNQKDKAYAQFDHIRTVSPGSALARQSMAQMSEIQKVHKSSSSAKKNDYGDYLSEINSTTKWTAMPIRVWVQQSKYTDTVYQAFNEWQYVSGGLIKFTKTNSESQGNIKVYFTDQIQRSGNDTLGLTTTSYINGNITGARIQLVYKYNGKIFTQKELYPIALHEIGHALGINGHSTNNNDVMFPNNGIIGIHTSKRDVNTLKAIYKK